MVKPHSSDRKVKSAGAESSRVIFEGHRSCLTEMAIKSRKAGTALSINVP